MPILVYINGSINSGKSTVGSLLAKNLPGTVHIEVDELRQFADCLSLAEACPYCLEDAATLARNWLSRGFNVVVTWPISHCDYAVFERVAADAGVSIYAFTLRPALEVAMSDRDQRQLTERERARIREQYRSSHIDPGIGTVIDNSDQTPAETLATVRATLGV
ncbi:MAG: AAA family ATPase [Gemmatimonadota bacterium]|nr:AAA family ATPase [Gemmatimonadota bacterium]